MAKARQIQLEIEKKLKSIDEGCDMFNNTLYRLQNVKTQTQKERYDHDLKKEIKKLQKLRESVRVYQSNAEVRDKTALNEARKKIEDLMATYKNWEKESKTKAFSKEGLANTVKVDPYEEEKEAARDWIWALQATLSDSLNKIETELELFRAADKALDLSKFEQVKLQHAAYSYHRGKLEQVLRALENDSLDLEVLEALRNTLKSFLEHRGTKEHISSEINAIYKELDLSPSVTTYAHSTEEEPKCSVNKKPETAKTSQNKPELRTQEPSKPRSVWATEPSTVTAPRRDEHEEPTNYSVSEHTKKAIERSFEFSLRPQERELAKSIIIKNSSQSHPKFPQKQLFSHPDEYKMLELDTLFFIFYHQAGTYQQYLAAHELSGRAWIYHKRFQTWFQRLGEPKSVAADREKGSYVYFDFQANWSQRKKADFEFEYAYMERNLPS